MILFTGGSLCPGNWVSVGVGVCPVGLSVQGALCPEGSLPRGGSLSRGYLFTGVFVRGSRSRGLCQGDPLYGNVRAVRISLECILVSNGIGQYTDSKNTLSIPGITYKSPVITSYVHP